MSIATLQTWIERSGNIVFFGGAGVSTESGIPDFRSVDGLYQQRYAYPPEEILSHHFFLENTAYFYRFYREKMLYLDALPNPAHKKLAELEAAGKVKAVVTQNIDGLHQKAGSKTVYELHGSVHRNHCEKCSRFFDAQFIKDTPGVPRCPCGGRIKPDVVLYEEPLDDATVEASICAIAEADLLSSAVPPLSYTPPQDCCITLAAATWSSSTNRQPAWTVRQTSSSARVLELCLPGYRAHFSASR